MKTVVYDTETMEPITVVEVPISFIREMEQGVRPRQLAFPTYVDSIRLAYTGPTQPTQGMTGSFVRLDFELVVDRFGNRPPLWLCLTGDGETALLLRSVFLSGQNREVKRREEQAFSEGFFAAVTG